MSYRIAISLAAAAIGSCIATEAIAQTPAGFSGAAAKQVQQLEREKREKQQQSDRELSAPRAAAGFGGAVAPQMQARERKEQAKLEAKARAEAAEWGREQELEAKARAEAAELESTAKAPAGFAGAAAPQAGATGGRYYAPASDNGNATACGRFPYPPCKKTGDAGMGEE
jgi:hypothetical protein